MLAISGTSSYIVRAEQDIRILNQVVDVSLNRRVKYIIYTKGLIERLLSLVGILGLPLKILLVWIGTVYYWYRLSGCKTLVTTSDRDRDFLYIAIVKAAQQRNVNIELWILSEESDGITIRERDARFWSSKFDEIISKLHGPNLITRDDKKLKFYLLSDLLILRIFNTFSQNPWKLGYGVCNEIVTFNQFQYKLFKNRMSNKVVKYNELFLNNTLDQDIDIIVALPQLYEHKILSLKENKSFIHAILSSIDMVGHKVGVSLHPKMKYGTYENILSEFPHYLINDLQKEIGRCKLFICINSTTAYWATSLGIKVIMINFHELNVTSFEGVENIKIVKDLNGLRYELSVSNAKG